MHAYAQRASTQWQIHDLIFKNTTIIMHVTIEYYHLDVTQVLGISLS